MFRFVDKSLKGEFKIIDPRLRFILYAMAGFLQEEYYNDLVITSLIRSSNKKSVHAYGRGADIRTAGFAEAPMDRLVDFVNNTVIYGRKGVFTIKDERKEKNMSKAATGPHLHVQVSGLRRTAISRLEREDG